MRRPHLLHRFEWLREKLDPVPDGPVLTRGFLVLGMHRSGTSCLTGLLESSGLWLGDVARKSRFNRRGNLEHPSIRKVTRDLLDRHSGSWRDIPEVDWLRVDPRPVLRALAPYRENESWVIKDPRMLLMLPAFLPHLPHRQLVGSFRHPEAVARSLEARNQMPLAEGVALWTQYNRRLVELHQKEPFPLVSFDLTGAPYLEQFERLCRQLEIPVNREAAHRVYEANLVHQAAAGGIELEAEPAHLYAYLRAHQI